MLFVMLIRSSSLSLDIDNAISVLESAAGSEYVVL